MGWSRKLTWLLFTSGSHSSPLAASPAPPPNNYLVKATLLPGKVVAAKQKYDPALALEGLTVHGGSVVPKPRRVMRSVKWCVVGLVE